ncbi:uncharacterized protein HaLaN_21971 [Haematococcus lacustris]|uniref:Uncharacterized protein n=1 Tax=Haematococcus lacustris TaxID=44745 RepID=A0A699ZPP0_HAELA|nr:uncharacterized protein HaLaN_21971 [Haematococcus lacustris]
MDLAARTVVQRLVMTRPSQVPYAKPDVIRAFQIFSTPGDPPGKIKVEHLEQMLLKYAGEKFPPEEIVRLINGLEVDPEGKSWGAVH